MGITSEKIGDSQILINAIQKVAKNFGAFVLVDNCEYEFHPEIYSALRRIDKKYILFNFYFF